MIYLAEQTPSAKLKAIVTDIQKEVEAGQTLSSSMRKYPRVFNNLFVGLVRAGEVGGVLEESGLRAREGVFAHGFFEENEALEVDLGYTDGMSEADEVGELVDGFA